MRLLAILLLIAAATSSNAKPPCGSFWSGGISWTPMPGHHHPPFEIIGASCEDGHLYGMFLYSLNRFTDDPPRVKQIKGTATPEKFWPNVAIELADSADGPWKRLATSSHGSDTARPLKGKRYYAFDVKMDAIATYIGKAKWARVVLESGGETALIDIDQMYNHHDGE
jgi:hypothetical protein